jgi:hypothetical protein
MYIQGKHKTSMLSVTTFYWVYNVFHAFKLTFDRDLDDSPCNALKPYVFYKTIFAIYYCTRTFLLNKFLIIIVICINYYMVNNCLSLMNFHDKERIAFVGSINQFLQFQCNKSYYKMFNKSLFEKINWQIFIYVNSAICVCFISNDQLKASKFLYLTCLTLQWD